MTHPTTDGVYRITVPDPGLAQRLAPAAWSIVRDALRQARRADAVLLEVDGAAWHVEDEVPADDLLASADAARDLVLDLLNLPAPVVLALDGPVSGFGLALMLAADLRCASVRTTVQLTRPESALLGPVRVLVEATAGRGVLERLAWTGSPMGAREAYAAGLFGVLGDRAAAAGHARQLSRSGKEAAALKSALNARRANEVRDSVRYERWLLATISRV